jgi:hypothetical protein
LNNPESSKHQSAFLSKSTFTEYALKQLANKLIDDGTDWFLEFGKLRERIDHRFPGHGLSLENTEDVEPQTREGLTDLWDNSENRSMHWTWKVARPTIFGALLPSLPEMFKFCMASSRN